MNTAHSKSYHSLAAMYTQLKPLLGNLNYHVDKIENKKEKSTEKTNERPPVNDENVPVTKEKTDTIKEYISTETKIQVKSIKVNLNQEKIEAKVSIDSDTEPEPKVAVDSTNVTPKYFCGTLRDYQLTGLGWLKMLGENGLSGILADEMGLGKTIQVIALICHFIEKGQTGPYLIVVSLSTLSDWLMEFKRFAPTIPVVSFHGTRDERNAHTIKIRHEYHVTDNQKTQPIVLTTYEVLLHESIFLRSLKWEYIIVDEGQRIKNPKCKLIKMLKSFQSINRLILTGTPLQNNLAELWSILSFLLPDIFNNLSTVKSWFGVTELQHQHGIEKFLKQEEESNVLSLLCEALKPIMLRRTKNEVCLEIPPKKELNVYAPLTELQHDLYKAVLNYDLQMLSKIEKPDLIIPIVNGERPKRQYFLRSKYSGSVGNKSEDEVLSASLQEIKNNNWKAISTMEQNNLTKWKQYTDVTDRNKDFLVHIQFENMIPMYKKIVNHPYLIHCPLNPNGSPKIDNDLIKSSGKLLVLDAMLKKLKVQGHKILLFSTMTTILDMIEDYLSLRDYNYVRLDGTTRMEVRKNNCDIFNSDPDMFLFLTSIGVSGVRLNLTGADTVIIYDSDWNPQVDIQAMARCHRIGQTKPIVIYKLCTGGTIDEAIFKRSEAKRIFEKVVMAKEMQCFNRDTLCELKKLMESKEYKVVTFEKEVFTEMELDKLLDRSDLMINNNDILKSQE